MDNVYEFFIIFYGFDLMIWLNSITFWIQIYIQKYVLENFMNMLSSFIENNSSDEIISWNSAGVVVFYRVVTLWVSPKWIWDNSLDC